MTHETITATGTIDGAGWVHESLDGDLLTAPGLVFRISMYHANHPDGH